MERTFTKLSEMFGAMEADMADIFRTPVAVHRHRITSKDGHIVVTGDFKTLTVNGKRFAPKEKGNS